MEVDRSDLILSWIILVQNELVQNRASNDQIFMWLKSKGILSVMEEQVSHREM